MTAFAPADWYPDPDAPGQLRYWDGQQWTEHLAPAPPVQPPAPSPTPSNDRSAPTGPVVRPGAEAVKPATNRLLFRLRGAAKRDAATTAAQELAKLVHGESTRRLAQQLQHGRAVGEGVSRWGEADIWASFEARSSEIYTLAEELAGLAASEVSKGGLPEDIVTRIEAKQAALARWEQQGAVAVTTYETLKSLPTPTVRLSMLIVDEAHYAKNPDAQRSQAVRAWSQRAGHVLFMSGTPLDRLDEFCTLVG